MTVAELKPPRRARLGVAVLVAMLHLIVAAVLVRAFAPQLGQAVLRPVTAAFDVTMPAPPPPPPVAPSAKREAPARTQSAAAPAGKKADPRETAAPSPRIVLAPVTPAPPVAATGVANSAGARDAGQGTGAGGAGTGLGAGTSGSGTGGGGGATRPQKIAGDIVSARDYPRATRALRLGSAVVLALTVGTDGRVADCRIVRPSADPDADRITCWLATERFRFRPARDAAGRAITSTYGWQQRWFAPTKAGVD